jgi:predicted small metal-binding protein
MGRDLVPMKRGDEMPKTINCECGEVIRADSEEALLAKAEQHINDNHPDLVGTVTRDDLLAMAEEE